MFFQAPAAGVNKPITVPAPIGGLNARDSLAAMPETDAVIMQNWWPQPYGCSVRKGYVEWNIGLPGTIKTIASWAGITGDKKTFAWAGIGMYDVTARGVIGAAIVTNLSSSIWETVTLTNAAGNRLICVNGFDDAIIYSAAGVARITAGDGIVEDTWAGINPASAVAITVHQHRLWVVEKNSTAGWYLPPDAVQGTFEKFDFGPLFSRGGYLQYLTTWTLDDGNGAEDHLLAVSSRGEAVVYGGTDPNNDSTWGLVGVYYVGAPVSGRRCHAKAGGDQILVTEQGAVSMQTMLASTKVNEAADKFTTDKIKFLISELTAQYSDLEGWQVMYVPKLNMILVNVPSVVQDGNIQLAANQLINAWTQFTGMDSACWAIVDGDLYFGDYQGRILRAWEGNTDDMKLDGTGDRGITSTIQQSYSYMGIHAVQKQVGLFRPTFVVNSKVTYNAKILYNFQAETLSTPSTPALVNASSWNHGLWNSATWGGGDSVQQSWIVAEGIGVAASLKMVMQTDCEVLWVATDYSMVSGVGIL